jgi:FixJ family two-component response regulator
MPEMNGRELANRLQVRHPGLRTLFISGYPADVIAQHGVLDAGVLFLQKPFTMESIASSVRAALDAELAA